MGAAESAAEGGALTTAGVSVCVFSVTGFPDDG